MLIKEIVLSHLLVHFLITEIFLYLIEFFTINAILYLENFMSTGGNGIKNNSGDRISFGKIDFTFEILSIENRVNYRNNELITSFILITYFILINVKFEMLLHPILISRDH